MMATGQVMEELKRQVINLNCENFKVMLIWDPVASEDVGWMIAKKDVQMDLIKFQFRDVNIKTLVTTKPLLPSPACSSRSESSGQVIEQEEMDSSISMHMGRTNMIATSQEAVDFHENKLIDLNENRRDTVSEEVGLRDHSFSSHSSLKQVFMRPKVEKLRKKSCVKRQCPHCTREVSDRHYFYHLKNAHNVELEKIRVNCDECNKSVFKFNLEFHKSNKHSMEDVTKPVNENFGFEESNLSMSHTSKVEFKIVYQGRHFDCSRTKSHSIKGILRKFCKQIGEDLVFKFHDKALTGTEEAKDFDGGVIIARVLQQE